MSHPVIHKTDIGKVKTSKNVMKLLKLLLTVIVKHPVYLGLVILVHWNFPLSLARVFAFHSKFVPTTASIDNDS